MKFIQQNEQAECGLACLVMIGNYLGHDIDLASARLRFKPSLRGISLPQLISLAGKMSLRMRPLKVEVHQLNRISVPAILHWEFNHFVVLDRVAEKEVVVLDPARGRLTLSISEVAASFTGVAIEVSKAAPFEPIREKKTIGIKRIVGPTTAVVGDMPLLALTVAVAELIVLLMPILLKQLLDAGAISGATADQLVPIGSYVLFGIVAIGLTVVRSGLLLRVSNSLFIPGAATIFEHLLRLPYNFFQSRHYSDIAGKFDSLGSIHRIVTLRTLDAVLSGGLSVILILALAAYDGWIAILIVGVVTLALLLQRASAAPITQLSTETLVCAAKQANEFHQTLRGIQTIQVFGMSNQRLSRWMNEFVSATNARSKEQMALAVLAGIQRFLFSCGLLLVVFVCARRSLTDGWGSGTLVLVTTYAVQALTRSELLATALGDIRGLVVHKARIADILLTEPVPKVHAVAELPDTIEVELKDVWFRHSPDEPWIIRNANLKVVAGESVAIMGPSGSGKTTLIKLILGLFDPVRGEVLINGVPTTAGGRDTLRECAASVLQDDRLFNGSIAENIGLFSFDLSLEDVRRCAAMADIASDVEVMPMKYHTLIGDTAGGLSGGQRQRILLARALFANPRLLLLDEATSHLDLERERSINKQISELKMTRIIVAHRPETIYSADRAVDILQICK